MTHNTKIYPSTGINNTDCAQLSQLAWLLAINYTVMQGL